MNKKPDTGEIQIVEIHQGVVTVYIRGVSPLVFNSMSSKVQHELLMPKGRKTTADRAATQKHMPLQEYQNSVYRNVGNSAATRLCFPAPAFKRAMATAALDIPGAKRSEIGRLCWIEGVHVDIFGVPQMLMSVVRMADIKRTPDIRVRAILPEWCAKISVRFVKPKLNEVAVVNLLAAAGIICGIGDGRQEKGALSFGQFTLVGNDDADWKRIAKTGGLAAQDKALTNPSFFDNQTEELYTWWCREFAAKTGRAAA